MPGARSLQGWDWTSRNGEGHLVPARGCLLGGRSPALETDPPGFEFCLCDLPAVESWVSVGLSQSLSFLLCEVGSSILVLESAPVLMRCLTKGPVSSL